MIREQIISGMIDGKPAFAFEIAARIKADPYEVQDELIAMADDLTVIDYNGKYALSAKTLREL